MRRTVLLLAAAACAAAFAAGVSTRWCATTQNAGRCDFCARLRASCAVILRRGIPAHVREWRCTVERHNSVCPYQRALRAGGAR